MWLLYCPCLVSFSIFMVSLQQPCSPETWDFWEHLCQHSLLPVFVNLDFSFMVYYPRRAFRLFFFSMTVHTGTLQNVTNTVFVSTANSSCDRVLVRCLTSPLPPAMSAPVIVLSKVVGPSFELCFSFSVVQQNLSYVQTSRQGLIDVQNSR